MRLIPPAHVKPFVKRQKNDAADAEAICEAAQRPGMRFVAVKDEEQQASAAVFRARDLLVRQRTPLLNARQGLLAEHGWVTPKGLFHMAGESFRKGRDFAAWLGLTPLQRSTGGKQKLGAISKIGERTLRRLLIIGSAAVVLQASKRGAPAGSWLADEGKKAAHAGDGSARQQDGTDRAVLTKNEVIELRSQPPERIWA